MADKNSQTLTMLVTLLLFLVAVILVMQIFTFAQVLSYPKGGVLPPPAGINNTGQLTITASGTASAPPTRSALTVSLQGLGKTAAVATANLTNETNQLNSSILKYINNNASLITTTYFNLYQSQGYYYTQSQGYYNTYNGYIATEQVSIQVPNLKNLSKIIGALSSIKNLTIYSYQATLSNSQITQLRSAALSNATANATSQAYAVLPNKSLTVINVSINNYRYYPIYINGAALKSAVTSPSTVNATGPQLYGGTTSVTESVTITFSYPKK